MKKLQPVSIWGIEFDALISENKTLSATIPSYPVETGYQVSDAIINNPLTIDLVLYVTDTPVTWLQRHGRNRVQEVCALIQSKWENRELAKIVTPDTIYTNMGLTNISIEHTKETGYARQISITAQKVNQTTKKLVLIPDYDLLSGASEANASTSTSEAKAKSSVLYGLASGLGR